MKGYDDSEFLTDSPEEIREREQQEEIKRIVRSEFRRVQSGKADEDMAEDVRREQQEREEAEKRASRHKWLRSIGLLLTGEILVRENVARFYSYASYIALMFFLSIVTLFAGLRVETKCNRLEREVELLHERSIRFKEQRYQKSSHSAIVEELERRGIELYDPLTPTNIIK